MRFIPDNFPVWTEIPVRDLEAGTAFYETVTGGTLSRSEMDGAPIAVFQILDFDTGVAGHLCVGAPAGDGRGPRVHLAVAGGLEAALARVTEAGGTVDGPPVEIPQGRFAHISDPDGNALALFQPGAAR